MVIAEQQVSLTAALVTVLAAVLTSGFAGAVLKAWVNRRRAKAQEVDAWVDAADGVVKLLRGEIERLRLELADTRTELAQTRDELRKTRAEAALASQRVEHLERQLANMEGDGR